MMNTHRLLTTIVAPVGSSKRYDATSPVKKQNIEIITDIIITCLNLCVTRIADNAGKIIRLEIRSVPIILMPITMVTAVSTYNIVLYISTFRPVARAKFSSNVIANIGL